MTCARLDLPTVTLCAATSVNVDATVKALVATLKVIEPCRTVLFTDRKVVGLPDFVEQVAIEPLRASADYSRFILKELQQHIVTPHCMVIQWDGYPINAGCWDPAFLECDYIGAPWPQFPDAHNVGNGGFSIRSKRLLQACMAQGFEDDGGPEDIVIGRKNRQFLEQQHGIRFASSEIAELFSYERGMPGSPQPAAAITKSFGFHGVFNLVQAIDAITFDQIYRSLDHRAAVRIDLNTILRALVQKPHGTRPAFRVISDWFRRRLR